MHSERTECVCLCVVVVVWARTGLTWVGLGYWVISGLWYVETYDMTPQEVSFRGSNPRNPKQCPTPRRESAAAPHHGVQRSMAASGDRRRVAALENDETWNSTEPYVCNYTAQPAHTLGASCDV